MKNVKRTNGPRRARGLRRIFGPHASKRRNWHKFSAQPSACADGGLVWMDSCSRRGTASALGASMDNKTTTQLLFALTALIFCERVFAAPKIINKMTEAQCKTAGGRVDGDYPPSCKDNEIALGMVSMKCPCVCCAPAKEPRLKSDELPQTILDRIPPPKREIIKRIGDSTEWRNPLLMVGDKDIHILFRTTTKTDHLLKLLSTLPGDAWPYGKAVGVQIQSLGSQGDPQKVPENLREVLKMLKSAGIMAVQWPSA